MEVSTFDGGFEGVGICGCDSDDECGDAGLVCLPSGAATGTQAGVCGVPCTSPQFPGCSEAFGGSLCNANNGLCFPCSYDGQCQAAMLPAGPICLQGLGTCGCGENRDCPPGEICQPDGYGACVPSLSPCVHASCQGTHFCNWDSGVCEPEGFSCLADSDCDPSSPFCDPETNACVKCLTNSDCIKTGQAANGVSFCSGGYCTNTCRSDSGLPRERQRPGLRHARRRALVRLPSGPGLRRQPRRSAVRYRLE